MTARDGFESFYAEKIWSMIPAVHRARDVDEGGNTLRGIVEVIARQAAQVRRSHDRLWEDQFAEWASTWALSYIGALVGTRPLGFLDARAQRADVVKTIHYRRRKGTPAILEALCADIAGWDGVLREGFTTLARAPHRLDAPRDALAFGRLAALKPASVAELAGGPFDPFAHLADLRAPRGSVGRYGIQRLVFHLHTLRAVRHAGVEPLPITGAPDSYTIDPSGRDVPLFQTAARADAFQDDSWRPARPWEPPAPIRCRMLNDERFSITAEALGTMVDEGQVTEALAQEMRVLIGRVLASRAALEKAVRSRPNGTTLAAAATLRRLRELCLRDDCGKAALIPAAVAIRTDAVAASTVEATRGGDLSDPLDPRAVSGLVVDPYRGRIRFPAGTPPGALTADVYLGHADVLGAGGFDHSHRADADADPFDTPVSPPPPGAADLALTAAARWETAVLPGTGTVMLLDSVSHGQPADLADVQNLRIAAANQERPFVRLAEDWQIGTAVGADADLLIEGIWFGAATPQRIVITGDFERLTLRHVTVDPGGATTADPGAPDLPPVDLIVSGRVETLRLQHAVTGPIAIDGPGAVEALEITDSVVQAPVGDAAIDLPQTPVRIERSSITGALDAATLYASNTVIDGPVSLANAQDGCFRFSAAPIGSVLPRPYRSHELAAGALLFRSRRYGDPDYMRLSPRAHAALRRGGEGGGEMGVFHRLQDPHRADGLRRKVEEYMPFGLLPVFVFET